jgi:hypothetical protein
MKTWQLFFSIVLFQVTWLSAAFTYEIISLLGLIGLMIVLKYSPVNTWSIVVGIIVALGLGILMDASLYRLNIYYSPGSEILFYLNIPIWLVIMWLAFSTTLFSSLYWALSRPIIFIGLCALLGPASYLAGREIGIIQFENTNLLFIVFSWSIWSLLFLLIWHQFIKRISI